MKKKELVKLKSESTAIFFCILFLCIWGGLFIFIDHLTHCAVNRKPNVIAYKITVGYLSILAILLLIGIDFTILYSLLEKKFKPIKKKNQKIPSHKKEPKGKKLLKHIKTGWIVINISVVLLVVPICVNSRCELQTNGIYKITLFGKEKPLHSSEEIIGFKIQVGEHRNQKSFHTTYYPEIVTKTKNKDYYFSKYKNIQTKKAFFVLVKNNSNTDIDMYNLQKYYDKFSKANRELVDLIIE